MSRPVMVDSSWYIAQMRLGKDPLRALEPLAETRDIAVCGVIMSEVGRGIRDRAFLNRFLAAWSDMLWVESTISRWQETTQLAWNLDRQGLVLPLADLHVATCARHIGAVVLTLENHFLQNSRPRCDRFYLLKNANACWAG